MSIASTASLRLPRLGEGLERPFLLLVSGLGEVRVAEGDNRL